MVKKPQQNNKNPQTARKLVSFKFRIKMDFLEGSSPGKYFKPGPAPFPFLPESGRGRVSPSWVPSRCRGDASHRLWVSRGLYEARKGWLVVSEGGEGWVFWMSKGEKP